MGGVSVDYDYGERDNKFYPKLCGACRMWIDDRIRTELGAKGYCVKAECATYRTDWCILPEEVAQHREAMRNYTAINYKGERICKQVS